MSSDAEAPKFSKRPFLPTSSTYTDEHNLRSVPIVEWEGWVGTSMRVSFIGCSSVDLNEAVESAECFHAPVVPNPPTRQVSTSRSDRCNFPSSLSCTTIKQPLNEIRIILPTDRSHSTMGTNLNYLASLRVRFDGRSGQDECEAFSSLTIKRELSDMTYDAGISQSNFASFLDHACLQLAKPLGAPQTTASGPLTSLMSSSHS